MNLERGRCPVCGRDVAIRRGGEVREHVPPSDTRKCKGSGKKAAR